MAWEEDKRLASRFIEEILLPAIERLRPERDAILGGEFSSFKEKIESFVRALRVEFILFLDVEDFNKLSPYLKTTFFIRVISRFNSLLGEKSKFVVALTFIDDVQKVHFSCVWRRGVFDRVGNFSTNAIPVIRAESTEALEEGSFVSIEIKEPDDFLE